jgi:hypothetical protein
VARYDELLQVGKERVVRMQCYVRRALARLRVQRACALPLTFRASLLFRGPLTVVYAVWVRAVGDGPGRDPVMKQLKSRAGTLNEIIKSEAAYVQYLTVLMEVRRVVCVSCAFAVIANWGV